MNRSRELATIARYIQGASMVLVVAVLYLARDVFIPLALGVLVAFMLSPLVLRLQRLGVSNNLAVLATAALVFVLFVGFVFAIGSSVSGFVEHIPKHRNELNNKISNVQTMYSGWMPSLKVLTNDNKNSAEGGSQVTTDDGLPKNTEPQSTSASSNLKNQGGDRDQQSASNVNRHDGSSPSHPLFVVESSRTALDIKSWAGGAAIVLGPIGTSGLVIVFAVFVLIYRDDLRDRIVSVISQGNYVVTTDAFNEASERIGKYLLAQLVLNTGYGILFAFGLMVIGYFMSPDGWFPYVAVLGLIAGLARFVPYLGPMVGALLPLVLSTLIFPGFEVVSAVALLIVIMELVSNNLVEPWLYGSSTGVSPMAVIIAAFFWGWLWGPIGLLLATPLTVCVVVLGQNVPRFKFLSTLLSDKVEVPASIRGYQRLLAGDQFRITEFIKNQAKDLSVQQLLDKTVIPIIKVILRDKHVRDLSDEELLVTLRSALAELKIIHVPNSSEASREDSQRTELPSDIERAERLRVTAIPVHNSGEQLTLEAIRVLVEDYCQLTILDRSDFPDCDIERVVAQAPELVMMTVIPPSGLMEAKLWCTALRRAGYRGQVLVACFGRFKHYDLLQNRLRRIGASLVFTTATQITQKLLRIAENKRKNPSQLPLQYSAVVESSAATDTSAMSSSDLPH